MAIDRRNFLQLLSSGALAAAFPASISKALEIPNHRTDAHFLNVYTGSSTTHTVQAATTLSKHWELEDSFGRLIRLV